MSTNAYIGILTPDQTHVKYIYCHWDGYPEGVGAILANYYTDPAKINELIDGGNLSSLGEHINPDPSKPHGFEYNTRQQTVCVYYGRDRGELTRKPDLMSIHELSTAGHRTYFYYFNTKTNQWMYTLNQKNQLNKFSILPKFNIPVSI